MRDPVEPQPKPSTTKIDLASIVEDNADLQGLALDPGTGTLHLLVERRGLLELDLDGNVLAERRVGVKDLADRPYRDVAAAGEGRFILIADGEGSLWDEQTESFNIHFCVEAGFVDCTNDSGELIDANANGICDWDECIGEDGALIDTNGDTVCDWEQCYREDGSVYARDAQGLCAGEEPTPIPEPAPEPVEPLVQKNDAVALLDQSIFAAPRFYDGRTQVEASLRRYELATGEQTGSVDLTGRQIDITGLVATSDGILGVAASALLRFSLDGRLEEERETDVGDAAGVTVVDGEVLVLDRENNRIVALP